MIGENPLGLSGVEFVELTAPETGWLGELLFAFGFSRTMRHETRNIDLYEQGEMRFLVNREGTGHAGEFGRSHGPSISAMGWRFHAADNAAKVAVARGAEVLWSAEYTRSTRAVPAIVGIGGSLIYMIDDALPVGDKRIYEQMGFVALEKPDRTPAKGFLRIDHLTNNVERGTMERWASFYKKVFGFTEVRYFDIRGVKTGLTSYALRSPCGSFCIPINEADEAKSQINEYLEEYKGPGVQHLAFLTDDILASLRALDGTPIRFLDIDDDYYREVFGRVPNVAESHEEIQKRQVLVDGDEQGYLLQIFTKNLIGPIFIEIIQRKNHLSFGEGNFTALFRSIERDQARRGLFG
ncbi:MAG: 4-hydroxyphenylpyruvate dioxygenase [Polyangiaceae bacterium]